MSSELELRMRPLKRAFFPEYNEVTSFPTLESVMQVIVEVRAAEGGADAKLLVRKQAAIFFAYAERSGL